MASTVERLGGLFPTDCPAEINEDSFDACWRARPAGADIIGHRAGQRDRQFAAGLTLVSILGEAATGQEPAERSPRGYHDLRVSCFVLGRRVAGLEGRLDKQARRASRPPLGLFRHGRPRGWAQESPLRWLLRQTDRGTIGANRAKHLRTRLERVLQTPAADRNPQLQGGCRAEDGVAAADRDNAGRPAGQRSARAISTSLRLAEARGAVGRRGTPPRAYVQSRPALGIRAAWPRSLAAAVPAPDAVGTTAIGTLDPDALAGTTRSASARRIRRTPPRPRGNGSTRKRAQSRGSTRWSPQLQNQPGAPDLARLSGSAKARHPARCWIDRRYFRTVIGERKRRNSIGPVQACTARGLLRQACALAMTGS